MTGMALKTVVGVYSSCSNLSDLLWLFFLFDVCGADVSVEPEWSSFSPVGWHCKVGRAAFL